ncbi:DUF2510 domain-containing protein [Streptomyces sp. cmx-18-6]|uniref:DUF2510 domain-containing protein n=1 Tax=Streptomyces sp. cmx-18-6 TaxID=2790930 RepID=UPI00397ECF25
MSFATPPGWYPDTGAPGTERWWDGTVWTAHTRPLAAAHSAPQQSPQQPYAAPESGYAPAPSTVPPPHQHTGGASRGGRTKILAITLSGLLVLGAAVTGALLLGRGDDDGTQAAPGPSAPGSTASPTDAGTDPATASPSPSPESSADENPGVLVDQLNGITMAVPDGWEKPDRASDGMPTMRTTVSYDCPGTSVSYCYRGTVSSRTAASGESDPKALAEADISAAADRAYGEDYLGRLTHGGITSHRVLKAGPVKVAGRSGHLVRWQVVTGKGPGGTVQSLVFPTTVGSETPVIVRFAFDADRPELPVSLMDTITASIRSLEDGDTGGGTTGGGDTTGGSTSSGVGASIEP